MQRLIKNMSVKVTTGEFAGQEGVISTFIIAKDSKKQRVIVSGVGLRKLNKKDKKTGKSTEKEVSRSFDTSNIMPLCGKCKKPSRVRIIRDTKGKNERQFICCKSKIEVKKA